MEDPQFSSWKKTLTPLLYDWFVHHHLQWPTQSCRWGSQQPESHTYKSIHRLYVSEQTDNTEPQKLLCFNAEVCKESVASPEFVSHWDEFKSANPLSQEKALFHRGEVNKIRELPQHPHIVVTHTDAPWLYVWNTDRQPGMVVNRKYDAEEYRGILPELNSADSEEQDNINSAADLKLVGHEQTAQFALGNSTAAPAVASGGQDQLVLLWDLADSASSLLSSAPSPSVGSRPPELQARTRLEGHAETVEDVCFRPGSCQELVSVGDDKQILFWDTRAGNRPVIRLEAAHGRENDIQCVDWSPRQAERIATGAWDGSLKVWDHRMLGSGQREPVATFRSHTAPIMHVEWYPLAPDVLASGGEDRTILVWNLDPNHYASAEEWAQGGISAAAAKQRADKGQPHELMFRHVGHRQGKVVDFQWHATQPYTMLSISDDTQGEDFGGGTLQLWRISPLVYKPRRDALEMLEAYRDYIVNGRPEAKPAAAAGAVVKVEGGAAASGVKEEPADSAAGQQADAAAAGSFQQLLGVVAAGGGGQQAGGVVAMEEDAAPQGGAGHPAAGGGSDMAS